MARTLKASTASQAQRLTDIPNIGPSIAGDLAGLGLTRPADLVAFDPVAAYDALRGPMGERHDPCVLDVLLSAKAFMNGAPAQPWWAYTVGRKAMLNRM